MFILPYFCLLFLSITFINSAGRLKIHLNLHSTCPYQKKKYYILLALNINGERENFCWFPPSKNAYCFEDPVDENLISNCQIKNYIRICVIVLETALFCQMISSTYAPFTSKPAVLSCALT